MGSAKLHLPCYNLIFHERGIMPKKHTVLQVFVASPDDVKEERVYLEEIIKELNNTWAHSLGITLELIKYETHSRPSIGSGAQEIINEQIGNDYDIFIGIMWKRFGTPTEKFASGTQEEFENAFKRYETDKNISIMFYFKDEPVPLSLINTDELIKINKFKESLGPRGTLYWSYKSTDEFLQLLRTHLAKEVQYWKKRLELIEISPSQIINTSHLAELPSPEENATTEKTTLTYEVDIEEDLGFLDLIEIREEQFAKLNNSLARMGEYAGNIGKTMNEQTEFIDNHTKSGKPLAVHLAKKSANTVADEFSQFVARTNAEIPLLSDAFKKGINAIVKISETYATDFDNSSNKDIISTLEQIDNFIKSESETLKGITGFRSSIAALPGMTKEFKKAKRLTLETMDRLIEEFNSQINLLTETKKLVATPAILN